MKTSEFISKMDAQIATITKDNKPLALGVKSIMAIQSKRIWREGKNKDGGNIGEYEGGEVYLNPKSLIKGAKRTLPGFALKGKTGQSNFKNGNAHKTGYFENWLSFKKKIGRNARVKSVDLLLTGTLANDWANGNEPSKATARKLNVNNYYISLSQFSLDKVDKYNGEDNLVFGLSTKEKGQFLGVVQHELAKALKQ